MQPTAMIFGATGQDASYLAEFLLTKKYHVVGVARRSSNANDQRLFHVIHDKEYVLESGDVTDAMSVHRLIEKHRPVEIYNLAAQSHVKVSFDEPLHTWQVTAAGALNILEAIRSLHGSQTMKFYQASSSEMFGYSWSYIDPYGIHHVINGTEPIVDLNPFQSELTPLMPRSPYAVAKVAAHHFTRLYRESYGIFACAGILFNHESERRGDAFVTRKITKWMAQFAYSRRHGAMVQPLQLGNLDAKRDWGHAEDYVRAMWQMMQQKEPKDFVIATGETHSVRDFLSAAFSIFKINDWQKYIAINKDLMRPSEVSYLRGNAALARGELGWKPEIPFELLVKRMVMSDMANIYGEQAKDELGAKC